MKIYLLDRNRAICRKWRQEFKDIENVEVVLDDFGNFMDGHSEIDGVVSPANGFGMMDGGYDYAITCHFGDTLMKAVQRKIIREYYGIQPIATCISVPIPKRKNADGKQMYLLHTPVMTTPEVVLDPLLIYHAMRNTMMEAKKLHLESIVIPAWGGQCGCVPPSVIAKNMRCAYEQSETPNTMINWDVIEMYEKQFQTELRSLR